MAKKTNLYKSKYANIAKTRCEAKNLKLDSQSAKKAD